MSHARSFDPPGVERIFPDRSEMAARMPAFDWATTGLGSSATWPQNLRVAFAICLISNFPLHVWWGPDLNLFYNDAYISFLGRGKHPAVLGRLRDALMLLAHRYPAGHPLC